jgi:phosphoglycerate kinase
MFFKSSLGNMNKKQAGFGRSNISGISMSAGPRISGDVSMAAVKEDHMDEEMAKLSNKLGIDDLKGKIKGKKVLVRVDFNVPITNGKVTDPKRISATIPTIQYLKEEGAAAIILMSHCGRPDGNVIPKFSLEQVVSTLEKELGGKESVTFVGDCIGEDVDKAIANAKDGEIILLDNLRFYAEETGSGKKDGEKFKPSEKEVEFFRG